MICRNVVGLGHRLAVTGDQIISKWNQKQKENEEKSVSKLIKIQNHNKFFSLLNRTFDEK